MMASRVVTRADRVVAVRLLQLVGLLRPSKLNMFFFSNFLRFLDLTTTFLNIFHRSNSTSTETATKSGSGTSGECEREKEAKSKKPDTLLSNNTTTTTNGESKTVAQKQKQQATTRRDIEVNEAAALDNKERAYQKLSNRLYKKSKRESQLIVQRQAASPDSPATTTTTATTKYSVLDRALTNHVQNLEAIPKQLSYF